MLIWRRITHRPGRWLCGWLVVAVLFMQVATSAYACPKIASALADPVAQTMMPGCDGHWAGSKDVEQPSLCHAHCQQGSQATQPAALPDLPFAGALAAVLDWRSAALLPVQPAHRERMAAPGGSPPGSPPLYLRLLVLRN
jgi:hypothetical protein